MLLELLDERACVLCRLCIPFDISWHRHAARFAPIAAVRWSGRPIPLSSLCALACTPLRETATRKDGAGENEPSEREAILFIYQCGFEAPPLHPPNPFSHWAAEETGTIGEAVPAAAPAAAVRPATATGARASLRGLMQIMHATFVVGNGRRCCRFGQQRSRQAKFICFFYKKKILH